MLLDCWWAGTNNNVLFPHRSRLGCQICLKKSMNDMTVRVPEVVADARQSVDMSKNS